MSEPVSKVEPVRVTGPRWTDLQEDEVRLLQVKARESGTLGAGYKIDKSVILYPPADVESQLSQVHYDLLYAVGEREYKKTGVGEGLHMGMVRGDEGAMLFFSVPRGRDQLLNVRDSIVTEANNLIAVLGGNNFVPERLNKPR